MRTQVVVWTALPNGRATTPGAVNLSVFVNPQLITDEGGSNPTLELFPDWWDWPQTLANSPPLTLEVVFQGFPSVSVTPDLSGLVTNDWTAIFPDPNTVGVTSYKPQSFEGVPMHTFDMNGVETYVSNLYGSLGIANPLAPPIITTLRGRLEPPAGNPGATNAWNQLINLTFCAERGNNIGIAAPPPSTFTEGAFSCALGSNAIGEARAFHMRPAPPIPFGAKYPAPFTPPVPTLDFHQAVSALGSFPAVLRALGLVFDLVVPLPAGITAGVHNVSVVPSWTSDFTGASARRTINLTMQTNSRLNASLFRAVPVGPDYSNGMLDLADTSRFSVIDLDVDGVSEQLFNLSIALQNFFNWVEPQEIDGQTMAMTVPALRSTGPKVVWSGWGANGGALSDLMTRQATISTDVQDFVNWMIAPLGPAPALPVLQAEDIIKGHRFDVLPLSDPAPTWRSLQQRIGSYVFGSSNNAAENLPPGQTPGLDEGVTSPSASSAADTAAMPPPPDLYVSESIVNWTGWSLAAPRPGPQIDPSDQVHDNRSNPADTTPDPSTGNMNPQVSASFVAAAGTLPKLRFGNRYRYRGRAVDLAGNSLPPTDTDASSATAAQMYHRYQPVVAPAMAQIRALGPGEATLLLAIRDYQDPSMPIETNGRWLFPPKATEVLVETHGMLDGFVSGSPPNRADPPNPATWPLLAGSSGDPGLADAGLANLPAVQFDATNNNAPYFSISDMPTTPWLYDPLSRGVAILGFPGLGHPIIHDWTGGPWPGANAQLLALEPGTALGRHFAPGTTSAAPTETITLPLAGVVDLGISSALTSPLTLGVWRWMESAATTALQRLALLEFALRGQLWMITPYTVVRLVHAVRLPLVGPHMVAPVVTRQPGSVQASIVDTKFVLDARSTADIDAQATWIDRIDDPSDPTNNPAVVADSSVESTADAYKANVPDPGPLTAVDRPMEIFSPPTEFPILTDPGVIHNIGDTKHHTIAYQHTATSRFAEFFRTTGTITLHGTTPGTLGGLGVDPSTLQLLSMATELQQSTDGGATGDYQVIDPAAGTIALTAGTGQNYSGQTLEALYVPYDRNVGPQHIVQMPSSAPPKAPKIVRVSPAWALQRPSGSVEDSGGVLWARNGGYIRVYLDRPWWSSGNDELLGVVGVPPDVQDGKTLPSSISPSWVSLMGLDPISVAATRSVYPIAPDAFNATVTVPAVPYHPAYTQPPQIVLQENPGEPMQIWPYEVRFDPHSKLWYADVQLSLGATINAPPPGYFVRLALVRFQPYSIPGVEISTVALAGFCQPVADRFVSIAADTADTTNSSLFVSVSGPGYHGWRPPLPYNATEPQGFAETQLDIDNEYAPTVYEFSPQNTPRTSTMIVEVQVHDTSSGLSGELSWVPAPGTSPVMLTAAISATDEVIWSRVNPTTGGQESIQLPHPIDGPTPMRLRVSELDYFEFFGPTGNGFVTPSTVDTTMRRPFVALIPIV